MPTYQYRCKKHGETERTSVPVDARDAQKCSVCRLHLERLVATGSSFSLKGRGWFKDGY